MTIQSDTEIDQPEKPDNCTCMYPSVMAKTANGHHRNCQVYQDLISSMPDDTTISLERIRYTFDTWFDANVGGDRWENLTTLERIVLSNHYWDSFRIALVERILNDTIR